MALAQHGMFFLGINNVIASVLGVLSFTIPFQEPWGLFICLLVGACFFQCSIKPFSYITNLIALGLIISVTAGFFSAPVITSIIAAATIARTNVSLAIIVLCLQTSLTPSVEAMLSNLLFSWNLESASAGLIASLFLLTLYPMRAFGWRLGIATLTIPLTWASLSFVSNPAVLMWIAAIPSTILAVNAPQSPSNKITSSTALLAGFIMALTFTGWFIAPPSVSDQTYALLLGDTSSPEAKYYENYKEVLAFSGIPIATIESPAEIPPNSTVLLPWLTSPNDTSFAIELRKLALKRGWTVIMVGEHNNMGGVQDRIKQISGLQLLRNDLTVPPDNSDTSGHLHAASLSAWPYDATLNRGASVNITSLFTRVLLSGDGWWSEPDLKEWLWVGDYIWQPINRNGRMVLAASVNEGDARWVVLADTGPFLNQELISNPIPAARFLELASLWPLLILDIGLLLIGMILLYSLHPILIFFSVLGMMISTYFASIPIQGKWNNIEQKLSTYDERNFNIALSKSPILLMNNWALLRPTKSLQGSFKFTHEQSVVFGLIENNLSIGKVNLNKCKRIGALPAEGVVLMDAQACSVEGDAEVIIGNKEQAAVIRVDDSGRSLILVLDQNFLGRNAPEDNRIWLENVVKPSL